MEAEITEVTKTHIGVRLGVDELRVLVHRLAPEGSFLKHMARGLLPDNDEVIADELSELLRRTHDRSELGT
ncbi:hypothetical protein [Streptomyces sp. NPDC127100]|uniref:hypothetical protein n=1 Tax=Streptomyces sp. NPDC127100 TaxID=3347138 RepID=UPI0036512EA1